MDEVVCRCCKRNNRVVMAHKVGDPNTWFIFRKSGVEVKLIIEEGVVKRPTHFLTHPEREYIKKYIIPNYYGE